MKRYWLTEELARALTSLLGREALRADSGGIQDVSHSPGREIITCVLHADITKVSDLVDCTRLKIIPERGSQKAWQIVIDPTSADTFQLDVNGTTFGPFSNSDTTATFQAALSSITGVTAYVVHGNFFIFPATTVVLTDAVVGVSVYEVPWMPLVGDAFATKVGCRTLFESDDLKRGKTHSAEFVHGYGFAIGSSPPGEAETQIISFQVVSSDPTVRSALVDIEQRAFKGTVYGSVLDDTVVSVYDTDGCYLNEPNVDLTGRRGKAVLMYTDENAIETHFADFYEPPEKYWNVISLCCPNFTCEVG